MRGRPAPDDVALALVRDRVDALLVQVRLIQHYFTAAQLCELPLKRGTDVSRNDGLRLPNVEHDRAEQTHVLTAQSFGVLLKNRIYTGIIDAPGFSLRGVQGDFAPLVPVALFHRAQAVLNGSTAKISHRLDSPEFPLRRFVVCDCCTRPLTGSASKGPRSAYLTPPSVEVLNTAVPPPA